MLVFELDDHGHRPENLFLGHAAGVVRHLDERRLQEGALGKLAFGRALPAAEDATALLLGDLHVLEDLVHLILVDLAAHLGVVLPRHAHLHLAERLACVLDELVVDILVHEDAAAGAAHLTLVEQDAQLDAVEHHVPLGIGEDDVRRLAAQLQRGGNQLLSCCQGHITAHFSGAGECQFAETGVLQHVLAGFAAAAGDYVEYARRDDILNQTGQLQNAQGSSAGGLKNGAAAAGQNGGQFPGGHQEGEVPGNDLAHNADGFAQNQAHGVGAEHIGTAFFSHDAAGKIAEMLSRQWNIHCHGFADGLAVVQGFYHGKEFFVFVDDIGDLVQNSGAFVD